MILDVPLHCFENAQREGSMIYSEQILSTRENYASIVCVLDAILPVQVISDLQAGLSFGQ